MIIEIARLLWTYKATTLVTEIIVIPSQDSQDILNGDRSTSIILCETFFFKKKIFFLCRFFFFFDKIFTNASNFSFFLDGLYVYNKY
jgi:hypothetical protein